jgi:hypothetical protein
LDLSEDVPVFFRTWPKAAIERYKNLLKAKGTLETFLKNYIVLQIGPLAVIWVRGEWIKSLWPCREKR